MALLTDTKPAQITTVRPCCMEPTTSGARNQRGVGGFALISDTYFAVQAEQTAKWLSTIIYE